MTIYLDYIFIENFIIDFILFKETASIARKETKTKYTLIATTIASFYVVVMMYCRLQELNYLICKLLLAICVIYICFKPENVREYIKLIAIFCLVNVINVGVIVSIKNILNLSEVNMSVKIIVYISSFLISKYFIGYMWTIYKRKIKEDDLIYDVTIKIGNKDYEYRAFLDTGNSVFSYTYNIPVIFAELIDIECLTFLDKKQKFNINTVTLSNNQQKTAYIFDEIKIKKNNMKWCVKGAVVFEKTKFSKDYNMLLNYILYTNDMGGIKI